MRDRLTPERRSWNMSRIRGKNTSPEMRVRSLLHRMGFRFRLHGKKLPGRPDVVLSKYKTVIFVHGCFWHRHQRCKSRAASSLRLHLLPDLISDRPVMLCDIIRFLRLAAFLRDEEVIAWNRARPQIRSSLLPRFGANIQPVEKLP